MKKNIYESLYEHSKGRLYPFHMPGHKRNRELITKYGLWKNDLTPYDIDITEIDNFDNLHEPRGIIKEAEVLASSLYGSRESIFSVNGSTGAILGVIGLVERGSGILMARNCHKSVYHAVELYGLIPQFISGRMDSRGILGSINPTEVENILKAESSIRMVVITSPSFDGVVSDVKKIAEICHNYGVFLLVDEAHGAHFGLSESGYFPETAVRLGADFVVQSLHKTLPSYTQTAVVHSNAGDTLNERLRRQFALLETTSPSYIFMSGMEQALILVKNHGKELFCRYEKMLVNFRKRAEKLKHIRVFEPENSFDYDRGKLVILAGCGRGANLYKRLHEDFNLVMEMKSRDYVIALTSIFDAEEGFERLIEALEKLDTDDSFTLDKTEKFDYTLECSIFQDFPDRRFMPAEAIDISVRQGKSFVAMESSVGEVSADYVYFYPPGIPLLVPGEVIEERLVKYIKNAVKCGIDIHGGADGDGIFVCAYGKERSR